MGKVIETVMCLNYDDQDAVTEALRDIDAGNLERLTLRVLGYDINVMKRGKDEFSTWVEHNHYEGD